MALDKWKLFDMLGYEVRHKEVRRFHDSRAKIKIACAPRRTTKSYSAAKDVLGTILTPNTRTWVVGMSYGLAEKEFRYIHHDLVLQRDKIGLPKPQICLTNPRSGQLYIKWPWGSILEGKTGDRPDSLLGDAVDAVIYSEAATMPRAIRERYVAPTLNTTNGYEIIPTTPAQAAEWVHELWALGQEGKSDDVESFSWDVTANPAYNMEEFERAKKLYGADSPVFREQYLGEWVFYAGVVYPTFNPDVHVIEPFDIPASWPRIRGIDFGHRDPFVCLWCAVGPEQELYFYREYYNRDGMPIKHHAQMIKELSGDERIGLTIGDPSSKQAIEDMCYEGLPVQSATHPDREAGRLRVSDYMLPTPDGPLPWPLRDSPGKFPGKRPRVYYFDNMKETIREKKYYRWKEGANREGERERTEGEDHAMDTERYIVMTRPAPFRDNKKVHPNSFISWMGRFQSQRDKKNFIGAR